MRQIGYSGLQLAVFLVWSTILYRRFALTADFSIYHQAWYLIAHGHLNPYDTVQGFPFWQSHSEFLVWPLAPLYWVWPHDVLLFYVMDVGVAGAEMVVFTWLCEIAQRSRPGKDAAWLAGVGLVLLVVNPWMWWAVSFGFHLEALAVLFCRSAGTGSRQRPPPDMGMGRPPARVRRRGRHLPRWSWNINNACQRAGHDCAGWSWPSWAWQPYLSSRSSTATWARRSWS